MRFSNKSTLFLCLVLMSVFVALPVIAHQPPAGQTFAESHDGVKNSDSQSAEELDAETSHTHTAAPMVSSIEVENRGATDGDEEVDTARGTTLILVDDLSAENATVVDVGTAGEVGLKVTFNGPVYAVGSAGTTADAPTKGMTDLVAASITVLATGADAPGVDITSTVIGTPVVERYDPTPDDTATDDTALNAFLVTIPVLAALTDDNTPLSIYISVAENAVYSATRVVKGKIVQGRGSVASGPSMFSIDDMLPAVIPDPDTTAPTLEITHDPADGMALPASGNVTFTFEFSEEPGANDAAFTLGDVMITNGTAVDFSGSGMVYMLAVRPTNPMMDVTVSVAAAAVSDAAGNNLAAAVTETYMADDTAAPTVMISALPEMDANNMATGKIVFKFTFSEALAAGSFTADDIIRSTGVTLAGNPMMDATDNKVYTVLVNPAATGDTILTLKTGSVMDMQGNALVGDQQHKYVAPTGPGPADPMDPDMPTNIMKFSVPAESYVILVRDKAAAISASPPIGQNFDAITDINGNRIIPDAQIIEWSMMPNLAELFDRGSTGGGGALVLRKGVGDSAAPAVGTVGISEVMWAIDAAYIGQVRARNSQWIEIHNLNTTAKSVLIYATTGNEFTNSDRVVVDTLAGDRLYGKLGDATETQMVVDVMTNYFNGSNRGSGGWDIPGGNGSSTTGVNFVSMARIPKRNQFHLTRRHEDKSDKPLDGLYNNAKGAENSLDGRASGSWAAATVRYDRLATNNPDAATTNVPATYDFIGTPGRPNTHTAQTHITTASRRNVPASPVIFNELSNRNAIHADYEWIELRNVTDNEVNLRNYLISIVTSNSSDAVFYQFRNNDNAKIPAKGVLLLVASDPRGNSDHPLAVGWDVDRNPEDQARGLAGIGISATSKFGRYKVANTDAAGMFGGDRTGLPDDGKFVLILRSPDNNEGHRSGQDGGKGVAETGNADLNRVVDIAGWDDDLSKGSYPNAVSSTTIWPLHQMTRGVFSHNRLDADKVHYRRHPNTPDGMAGAGAHENKNEGGKAAYARGVGYTGIGYKRQAMDSSVHGGDPGYHGMTKNSAHDNDGGHRVIISEIMLSQKDERGRVTLPQWIELYNASDYAINLAGGEGVGWRLVIENPDDPIRTINFRNKGNVKIIQPGQTVLIVSGSARSFGSDTLPSATVFPDTRVFNVYKELKGHFDMASRTSPILNEKAFNITLIDGGKKVNDVVTYTDSDEVGNLDGNARTNDQGMWEFPDTMTEDGERSSLIRIFDDGAPRMGYNLMESNVKPLGGTDGVGVDGMPGIDMKYSWVHAADTDFVDIFVRHTWFGSENDFGTPANRAGQILPVELSFFRPTLQDGKVTIRWTTESELDNAGFNILRSETRNGEYKQVNTELIQGAGTTGERTTYDWVDPTAKPGVVYYYQIEDVSFAGEHQVLATTKLKGLISADGKLTTTWSELKQASQ